MEFNKDKFTELYNQDVSSMLEKKANKFSYLSWASAIKLVSEKFDDFTFKVHEAQDGLPYFSRGNVHFVKTSVSIGGVSKDMHMPIIDFKNQSIENPNQFHVNSSIMRCMVKNIALFGLGLSLYVGEDLADLDRVQENPHTSQAKAPTKSETPSKTQVSNTDYNKMSISEFLQALDGLKFLDKIKDKSKLEVASDFIVKYIKSNNLNIAIPDDVSEMGARNMYNALQLEVYDPLKEPAGDHMPLLDDKE